MMVPIYSLQVKLFCFTCGYTELDNHGDKQGWISFHVNLCSYTGYLCRRCKHENWRLDVEMVKIEKKEG